MGVIAVPAATILKQNKPASLTPERMRGVGLQALYIHINWNYITSA